MRRAQRLLATIGWVACLCAPTPAAAQADRVAQERSAVAANRTSAEAGLRLGMTLRRAGEFAAATAELRRVLLLAGARSPDMQVAVHREIARVAIEQGEFDSAMQACRQLLQIQKGKALGHACLAEAEMIRKRANLALPEVEKALAVDPGLYEAKVVEGYVRWQNGQEAWAETAFREAIARAPRRTEALVGLGRMLKSMRRTEAAERELARAYAADEADPVIAYELAGVTTDAARAASLLEKSIAGRPKFGAAHARLAEVAMGAGKLDRAEQQARIALDCPPVDAEWHALLAEVLLRRAKSDAALAEAALALKQVPNSARAKLVEADALVAKGEIDSAIQAYQAAFQFRRDDPVPLVRAAQACLQHERATTARGFADRAVSLFPRWAPAWEVAGDVAKQQRERAAARRAYEKALSLGGPIDVQKLRQKLRSVR